MRVLPFLYSVVTSERSIADDEYQNPTVRALQPAKIHTLDRYLFDEKGDYEIFLPIDDDTWGEFNIRQAGYVEKVNLIKTGARLDNSPDLYVIQTWSNLTASKTPNFTQPYLGELIDFEILVFYREICEYQTLINQSECNKLYPKVDPWDYVR